MHYVSRFTSNDALACVFDSQVIESDDNSITDNCIMSLNDIYENNKMLFFSVVNRV